MRKAYFRKYCILIVMVICTAALPVTRALAEGDSGGGGGAHGGSCDSGGAAWVDTCFGYSWQKYKVTMNFDDYSGKIYVGNTPHTDLVDNIGGCKEGWTFYNYGFEQHVNNTATGYQYSTQTDKSRSIDKMGWYKSNGGLGAGWGTINDVTDPLGYSSDDEAYEAFSQMQDWDYEHGTNYTHGMSYDDVGWFCWNPEAELSYLTSSHASVRNTSTATIGASDYVTTYAQEAGSGDVTVSVDHSDVLTGQSINLTFSHNVYTNDKTSESVGWTVTKSVTIDGHKYNEVIEEYNGTDGGNDRYEIIAESSSQSAGNTNGVVTGTTYTTQSYGNPKYIANTRPYNDGRGISYVHRDFYTVTFMKAGTYKFCEKITTRDSSYGTEACINVTVSSIEPETETPENVCTTKIPSSYDNSDEFSGTTSSFSSISSNIFTGENSKIYAKPTDKISFYHCYFPGAQKTRKSSGQHEEPTPSGTDLWIENRIGEQDTPVESDNIFEIVTDSYDYLKNQFSFNLNTLGSYSPLNNRFTGVLGKADTAEVVSDEVEIKTNAVNQTIWQGVSTDYGTNSVEGHHSWTWSGGRGEHFNTYSNDEWYDVDETTENGISSKAEVYVPYNYVTTGVIKFNSDTSRVYSGESIDIGNAEINVGTRYNDVTKGTYATKTPATTITVYSFYSEDKTDGGGFETTQDFCDYYERIGYSGCSELTSKSTTLNNSYNMNGSDESVSMVGKYNVYDIPAGYQYCIGISIYPAQSAANNIDPENGNTYISTPTCRTVYKKPIFQVWGGSVYSRGNIAGNRIAKTNIIGYYDFTTDGPVQRYYTSWVEFSINGASNIANVSSANATGYDEANLTADPGGMIASDYSICDTSILTLANARCSSSVTGASGVISDTSTRDNFLKYYVGDDPSENAETVTGTVDLSSNSSYQEANGIRRTYANGSINIEASESLATGRTHVIVATGDINIISDLEIADVRYTNLQQLPQYIIYAKGNLNIACNVNRTDAILIANGKVDTCYDGGDDDSEARSNQLRINGVIIADSLELGRTYGAATGSNSAVPAEIINVTPINFYTIDTEVNDKPKVYTTYLREIAPRY